MTTNKPTSAEGWQPIETAPQQEPVLVSHAEFPGWIAHAVDRPSVGWCYADDRAGPECQLKRAPTHWRRLLRELGHPEGEDLLGIMRTALERILKVEVDGDDNIWAGSHRCKDIALEALAKLEARKP